MVRFAQCLCLPLLMLMTSCGKSPQAATSQTAQNTNQQIFQVKGIIRAVRSAQKEVEIKHEAIPGYMPGMTMPFEVRDTNELTGLKPGEPVSFRLMVTDTEGWIDQIHSLGPATNWPSPAGQTRIAREVEPLAVGDILPEYHFTNQFSQALSTSQ